MPAPAFVDRLVAAGFAEDFAAVASRPGADNHSQVPRFASSLRGAAATIDWVLSHTRSYDYYANGARSLA